MRCWTRSLNRSHNHCSRPAAPLITRTCRPIPFAPQRTLPWSNLSQHRTLQNDSLSSPQDAVSSIDDTFIPFDGYPRSLTTSDAEGQDASAVPLCNKPLSNFQDIKPELKHIQKAKVSRNRHPSRDALAVCSIAEMPRTGSKKLDEPSFSAVFSTTTIPSRKKTFPQLPGSINPQHLMRNDDERQSHCKGGSYRALDRLTLPQRPLVDDQPKNACSREPWQIQKAALSEKFGSTGWSPRKRLSPDALEGIRALHAQHPDKYTTPVIAEQFKISPEAVRRILKSKWRPNEEEEERRLRRWSKRGENIWSQMAQLGLKPPKRWRQIGVGKSQNPLSNGRGVTSGQVAQYELQGHGESTTRSELQVRSKQSLADRIS